MYKVYQVLPGEELKSIADKLDMEMQVLCELNGLTDDSNLRAGENIVIPNQEILIPRRGVSIYITKEGDTLKTVTKKFGTNSEKIEMENENIYLLPEQLLVFKKENFM